MRLKSEMINGAIKFFSRITNYGDLVAAEVYTTWTVISAFYSQINRLHGEVSAVLRKNISLKP